MGGARSTFMGVFLVRTGAFFAAGGGGAGTMTGAAVCPRVGEGAPASESVSDAVDGGAGGAGGARSLRDSDSDSDFLSDLCLLAPDETDGNSQTQISRIKRDIST
eukprot:1084710-Prorocentrum_minimum.AAC.1